MSRCHGRLLRIRDGRVTATWPLPAPPRAVELLFPQSEEGAAVVLFGQEGNYACHVYVLTMVCL